jgi:hypothetical protein
MMNKGAKITIHMDTSFFGNQIKAGEYVKKKEWEDLTDDECDEIWNECLGVFDCLKMTAAKLKEKNG